MTSSDPSISEFYTHNWLFPADIMTEVLPKF